jgi:hypothetical protein
VKGLKTPPNKNTAPRRSSLHRRVDVLALFDGARKRKPGNPTGANQHTKEEEEAGNVDNVNGSSSERPTGNSAAAGLRKLQKAAKGA